jgi:hypothetical protein
MCDSHRWWREIKKINRADNETWIVFCGKWRCWRRRAVFGWPCKWVAAAGLVWLAASGCGIFNRYSRRRSWVFASSHTKFSTSCHTSTFTNHQDQTAYRTGFFVTLPSLSRSQCATYLIRQLLGEQCQDSGRNPTWCRYQRVVRPSRYRMICGQSH